MRICKKLWDGVLGCCSEEELSKDWFISIKRWLPWIIQSILGDLCISKLWRDSE